MSGTEQGTSRAGKARANRKRKSYLPLVFGVLCAGLAAEAGYAALTSPRFQVKTIIVRGNQELTPEAIVKAAAIPIGVNLFRIGARSGVERVTRLPQVRRATIHRRFPNRIVIQVEERKPIALLAVGENYYLVDETSTPYTRLDRDGLRLPVLRLDPAPAVTPGEPVRSEAFQEGMKALPMIDRTLSWRGALQVDPHLDLCLNKGEFSVRLGQPDGLERKLKILKGLLATDSQLMEKARYIDLSAPAYPALMPREPTLASLGSGASPRSNVSGGR